MYSSMLKKANMLMLTILHLLRISEITLKPKVKVMGARPVWHYWTQGNFFRGIVIWSGAARSVIQKTFSPLHNNF